MQPYQTALELETVYEIIGPLDNYHSTHMKEKIVGPRITVYGSVNLYVGEDEPATIDDLILDEQSPISGVRGFAEGCVPNYIYLTGDATKVILSGLKVKDLGAL